MREKESCGRSGPARGDVVQDTIPRERRVSGNPPFKERRVGHPPSTLCPRSLDCLLDICLRHNRLFLYSQLRYTQRRQTWETTVMSVNLPPQGTLALLVITVLVTLFLNNTGAKILQVLAAPVLWLWEAGYKKIAPYNPLSISLRSYKKHLKNSDFLSLLENPVGPALRVPLEQSFAPLRLTSGQDQPYVELFTYAGATPRFVVLGGPGTGKTTLMKSLLMSMLNGTCAESMNNLIPVFVALRKLSSSQQSVEGAIVSAFAEHHFPGAESFIRAALEQGRMVIVLDGLDEVGSNREFVVSQIQDFCRWDSNNHRNHVVVTCRENSYITEDLRDEMPDVVRVEPFAAYHMRVFLRGWPAYHGKVAMNLFGPIQGDRQIREICSNPLLLTILTGLYFEAENFELPSSRDRFYVEAIRELLEKRPARRALKQAFGAYDKQQILQRVALERLESASPGEDPEEFTREAIQRKATEVIGGPLTPAQTSDLIKELTETNGIIRPASDQSYTCSHRTIQEYLAACEARRSLEAKDVISQLGEKIYLREVIYFYCGLIDNIPQIGTVVTHFADRRQWEVAGRCLLNATQIPKNELLVRIADGLFQANSSGPALEILSSLAQRRGPAFDPFAQRLNDAITSLVGDGAGPAVSGLGMVLSSHPEVAVPLIPALLRNKSAVLRKLAISLLRDLGTDEALDQLVRLLVQARAEDKAEVARVISGLLVTRPSEMKQRADFLPDRSDPAIWPLEAYFPGRLAIPVAEALAGSTGTDNRVIGSAAKILEIKRKSAPSRQESKFVRQWRRVGLYAKFFEARQWCAGHLATVGIYGGWLAITFMVFVFILNSKGYVVIAQAHPTGIRVVDNLEVLHSLTDAAKRVVSETESKYPPSVHGVARMLPWNWSVHPLVPDSSRMAFELVSRIEARRDPYSIPWKLLHYEELPARLGREPIANFERAVSVFRAQPIPVSGNLYIVYGTQPLYFALFVVAASAAVLFFVRFFEKRLLSDRWYSRRFARVAVSDPPNLMERWVLFSFDFLPFQAWLMCVTWGAGPLTSSHWIAPTTIATLSVFLLVLRTNWPTNPAFESVKDLLAAGDAAIVGPMERSIRNGTPWSGA